MCQWCVNELTCRKCSTLCFIIRSLSHPTHRTDMSMNVAFVANIFACLLNQRSENLSIFSRSASFLWSFSNRPSEAQKTWIRSESIIASIGTRLATSFDKPPKSKSCVRSPSPLSPDVIKNVVAINCGLLNDQKYKWQQCLQNAAAIIARCHANRKIFVK